jgi:RimJ/RimL family protein N-acetyltransferase
MTGLRRVEVGDIELLESQDRDSDVAGEQSWFGFKDPGRVRRRIEAGETLTADRGVLAVINDDGEVVGDLSWLKVFNGPPPNGDCWNMGIWIVPDHRGEGHGSAAQRLGAAYLFEHTTFERVEASTETDNVAEQRALERAGFTREGVLRRACFRGGAWRDMVVFSKLRGEP